MAPVALKLCPVQPEFGSWRGFSWFKCHKKSSQVHGASPKGKRYARAGAVWMHFPTCLWATAVRVDPINSEQLLWNSTCEKHGEAFSKYQRGKGDGPEREAGGSAEELPNWVSQDARTQLSKDNAGIRPEKSCWTARSWGAAFQETWKQSCLCCPNVKMEI